MGKITVKIFINAPVAEVWKYWTEPQHIIKWNQPSEDWHTSRVENDLRPGGSFLFVMQAKDGSDGLDFKGAYDEVMYPSMISYTLTDGRKTTNVFSETGTGTNITETFDPANGLPEKDQELFCMAVLESFKQYLRDIKLTLL
ncbi:polyketide cyclase [Chitinophaga sp. SYP-B3965]|uniref:SRPBCC domain-containing protein n=1 Tax=Chitinophaga sp. SYP-B3965 TaxID=2663120 RepID=UPI0012999817|nr:SRPBCC domain-containing protein [Chitinophaga sp. SYP-B3965]MRG48776.1 polyketide cyclase [Chitinophaga sp. SYP-B3965]